MDGVLPVTIDPFMLGKLVPHGCPAKAVAVSLAVADVYIHACSSARRSRPPQIAFPNVPPGIHIPKSPHSQPHRVLPL